jgi:hypothetical protein
LNNLPIATLGCSDVDLMSFDHENHGFESLSWYKDHHNKDLNRGIKDLNRVKSKEEMTIVYVYYNFFWQHPVEENAQVTVTG